MKPTDIIVAEYFINGREKGLQVFREEDIMDDLKSHFPCLPSGEWRVHEIVKVLRNWMNAGTLMVNMSPSGVSFTVRRWADIELTIDRGNQ